MLLLNRKIEESVLLFIGDQVVRVQVLGFDRGRVSLGVTADRSVRVLREELMHAAHEAPCSLGAATPPPTGDEAAPGGA